MNPNRLDRTAARIQQDGLDAIVINPTPSLFYFSGLHFHLSERPVLLILPAEGTPAMILPELEVSKVESSDFKCRLFSFNDNPSSWQLAYQEACQALKLNGKKIGVETTGLRVLELGLLQGALSGARIISAQNTIAHLRMHKDFDEIMAMRKAVEIAQKALLETLPLVKIGMTELELAAELFLQLSRSGCDPGCSFTPIVSSGPNSANPHAYPSNRTLTPGDLLVIDWGAMVNGYYSDLTRTFAISQVSQELSLIADTVLYANATGRAKVRPGISAGEVDQAARIVIEQAGYGLYFTHRTGHGLGLEVHESPYIFTGNQVILEPGMTFTIEPGIYVTGKGGVRIEDDILVTDTSVESLSDFPRQLKVICC